jgi:lipopolysaccharide cholinephosphotransferase
MEIEFNPQGANVTLKDVKELQKLMLDILIQVDKFCRKHNLKYWLDSGTLLGAVRHKGFIPWDDDLDICMPVEDYDRFLEIAPKELPDYLFVQTKKTDKYYKRDFAKVRSSKGKIIEKSDPKNAKFNQGVYIDIFPNITIKNTKFHKFIHKLLMKLKIKISEGILDLNRFQKHFIRNFFIKLTRSLHQGWDTNKNLLVVRSAEFAEYKFILPIRKLLPLKEIEFEGHKFFAPNDTDAYLKLLYGSDYMELPPVEKRKTHSKKIEIFDKMP